jgi:hypothetical protein
MPGLLLLLDDPNLGTGITVSRVQSAIAVGDPASATFGTTPVEGNLLVAIAGDRSGGTEANYTITGSGWTKRLVRDVLITDANARRTLVVWTKVAGASEPTNVQVDDGTANSKYLIIQELQASVAGTWTFATSVGNDTGTGSTSPLSTGTTSSVSGVTSQIAVAILRNDSPAVSGLAWDNGFGSQVERLGNAFELAIATAIKSEELDGTKTTSVSWTGAGAEATAGLVVFNFAASGGGSSQQLASTLSGSGGLAASLSVQKPLAAEFTGTGTLTPSITVQKSLEATLNGAGSLSASLSVQKSLSATFSGSSSLSVSLETQKPFQVTLEGATVLNAALAIGKLLSASFSGSGSFNPSLQVSSLVFYCVRTGAPGNGSGSDWLNAMTSIPSSLERGAVYYFAEGSYGTYFADDVEDGTKTITFKKATSADHGIETGWNDTYGDGQVVFGSFIFHRDYYIVDGATRNEDSWNDYASYGFRISSIGSNEDAFPPGGDHITIRYSDIGGTESESYVSGLSQNGIQFVSFSGTKRQGLTVQRCRIHNVGVHIGMVNVDGLLVEYSYFTNNFNKESLGCTGGGVKNAVVRYNIFKNCCKDNPEDETANGATAEIGWWNVSSSSDLENIEIYGNVFWNTVSINHTDGIILIGGDGGIGWNGAGCNNVRAYNNTVVGFDNGNVGIRLNGTNTYAYNNLPYDIDAGATWFVAAVNQSDNDEVLSDPFVDLAGGDFRLTAAVAGVVLGAGFEVLDFRGFTRGEDTVWDRGAFEYDPDQETGSYAGLSATLSGSGALIPDLSIGKPLAAAMAGAGSLSPNLQKIVPLSVTMSGASSVSASLMVVGANTLFSTIAGSSAISASLAVTKPLSTTAGGEGSLQASLAVIKQISVISAGSSTLSSGLAVQKTLSSNLEGSSVLTALLSLAYGLTINFNGSTSLVADLSVASAHSLVVVVAGFSDLIANLRVLGPGISGILEGEVIENEMFDLEVIEDSHDIMVGNITFDLEVL